MAYAQQFKTDDERRKYAEKLFADEKYIEAAPHFLHFLSLDQQNHEYNFKYGACLTYTDQDKTKALKYLQYAAQSPSIDPLAYYFLGKAYQMSFRFTQAINQFETYKVLSSEKDIEKYNISHEIRSCANGKELLKNFSEIIVLSKKQSPEDKIQYSYDLTKIGGKLLTTEEFQSKIDKKKGYRAIVYFPNNPKAPIFYSSYGEVEGTGLDIYMRERSSGTLSEPVKLPKEINTEFDDNFGFLHSDGKTFYFASKGHNTMGGYDIFKSTYNPSTKTFSKPVNLDFKINTPADDILYLVDESGEYAYFSSNRASKGGYYDVYNIRNQTIPFTNIYIVGTFKNEIGNNLAISIKVEDNSKNIIGLYNSQANTGAYMIKIPKTGNFNYYVELEGNQRLYAAQVEVPSSSAMMIKQELILQEIDGDEMLVVRNLFDEQIDNSEELMANMFLEISDLEENAEMFDESIFKSAEKDDMFAQMGVDLNKANDDELTKIVDEIVSRVKSNAQKKETIIEKAYEIADEKSQEAENFRNISDDLLNKANTETDVEKRRSLQEEANEARIKAKIASQQAYLAIEYAKNIEKSLQSTKQNIQRVDQIASEVKTDIKENKKEEAVDKLRNLQVVAKNTDTEVNKVEDISQVIEKQVEEKELDLKTLENKLTKAEQNEKDIKEEISELEKRKVEAKKSQQEVIQLQIDEANEVLKTNEKKVKEYREDVDFAKKQVELMNIQKDELTNAFEGVDESSVTKNYTTEEHQKITQRTENIVFETKDVKIDKLPEGLKSETKTKSILAEEKYKNFENDLNNTNQISDQKQKLTTQKTINENYVKTIDKDILAIQNKISLANSDEKKHLEKDLKDLKTKRTEKESELKQQNNELLALTQKNLDADTSEEAYTSLDEQYQSTITNEVLNTQTIAKLQEINKNYIATIDADISKLKQKMASSEDELEKAAIAQKIKQLEADKNSKQKEQTELNDYLQFEKSLSFEKHKANAQKISIAPISSEFEISNKVTLITDAIKQVDGDNFIVDTKLQDAKSEIVKKAIEVKKDELSEYRNTFEQEFTTANQQLAEAKTKPRENKSENIVSNQTYEQLKVELEKTESLPTEEEKLVAKYDVNKKYIAVLEKDISALKYQSDQEQDPKIKQDLTNKAQELFNERTVKLEENKKLEENRYVAVTNSIKKADSEYKNYEEALNKSQNAEVELSVNKNWSQKIEDEKTELKKELSLTASPNERALIENRLKQLEEEDKKRQDAIQTTQKELLAKKALETIEETSDDKKYQTSLAKIDEIERKNFTSQEEKLNAKKEAQTELLTQIQKDLDVLETSLKSVDDVEVRTKILNEAERLESKQQELQREISETNRVLETTITQNNTKVEKQNITEKEKTNEIKSTEETTKEVVDNTTKIEDKKETTNVNETSVNTEFENEEARQLKQKYQSLTEKLNQLKAEEQQLKIQAEKDGAESNAAKNYQKIKEQRIASENELINNYREVHEKEMKHVVSENIATKQALVENNASEDKLNEIALIEKNAEKLFAHAKNLRYQATISPTAEVANIKLSNANKEEQQAIEQMKLAKSKYEELAKEAKVDTEQLAKGKDISEKEPDATFIAQNSNFKNEKAKQSIANSQTLINEISDLERQIAELEKSVELTKKQQSELKDLNTKKSEQEITLAQEISKATEYEIQANEVDKTAVKNDLNDFEISTQLKEYKTETEKEEQAINRLLDEAKGLEKQAESTKNLDEKKELYRQANIKRSIAVLKQNNVIEAYNEILVDNLIIQKEEAEIRDNNELSSQQFDKAVELRQEAQILYDKARTVEDSMRKEKVEEQEISLVTQQIKKQADTKIQLAEMVKNNANDIKELEDKSIAQSEVIAQMNEEETKDVRTEELYKKHYELSNKKNELESELNRLVIDLTKEELRYQNLINKGEQYEFEANVATNPDVKAELIQKAAETKEQAQLSQNKINDLENNIERLTSQVDNQNNQLEINLSRITNEKKQKIEAVFAKASDNTPLEKETLVQTETKQEETVVQETKQEETKQLEVVKTEIKKEKEQKIANSQSSIESQPYKTVDVKTFKTPEKIDEPIFSKIDENKAAYSNVTPIPINAKPIEGLVYRVQIGAFSKPVPNDVFKGFAPISGEKIEGSNLIRYMAGYFSQFNIANTAKNDIRKVDGYSDAFVVAFYNGEKISIARARELENQGVKTNELADDRIEISEQNDKEVKTNTETSEQTEVKKNTEIKTEIVTENQVEVVKQTDADTAREPITNFNQLQTEQGLGFRVMRSVEQYKGGVLVRINFKNGSPTNGTYILDNIPQGFTPQALTISGAAFSFENNQVKFAWSNTATENTEVSYVLYPSGKITTEQYKIEGVFVTAKGYEVSVVPDGLFQYRNIPSPVSEEQKTQEIKLEEKELDPVKATYYKDVKGAATAEQVEVIKGLFFTVQIGVYSKPVAPSALFNLSPLNTELIKTTGQIRYTTGKFKTIQEASVRKDEIRLIGVGDAFVTAYYNGERISVARARELLEQMGNSILAE
ncbi:MAG: hypothetical protein ACLGGV_03600 [Bacteroidia bacterium]